MVGGYLIPSPFSRDYSICVSYLNMITCFSVSSHLLFSVITSTQKVSYYVRTIASDVITDPNLFQMMNNIAFFNNSHKKAMK